jgi:hypothetical protein
MQDDKGVHALRRKAAGFLMWSELGGVTEWLTSLGRLEENDK